MDRIKKCIACGEEFTESSSTYRYDVCAVCSGNLVLKEEKEENNILKVANINDELDTFVDEYECEECGYVYESHLKECEICGEPNPNPSKVQMSIEQSEVYDSEDINSEVLLGDFITIDALGYIHIIDREEDLKYKELDRIKIYINDKVYKTIPVKYNELTIGRSSRKFIPTYDIGEIDPENYISRKHLMLYREEGQVYARNLSSKNTVHINRELLAENEDKVLNNNDEIILSGYIVARFFKSEI